MAVLSRFVPNLFWLLVIFCYRPAVAALMDGFEHLNGWSVVASEGVVSKLILEKGKTGKALRINFDFQGKGGHFILRKAFDAVLPENYALSYSARANAVAADFEFKLVDQTGQNVWWHKQRDFMFSPDWRDYRVKKRMLNFAWGPSGGEALSRVGSLEWVFKSPTGGKGSIWLDNLKLDAREPSPYNLTPKATASTSSRGHEASGLVDEHPASTWQSDAMAERQWVMLDFLMVREFGGLAIEWEPDDYAVDYTVQVSDDGRRWLSVHKVEDGNGGWDHVYMPDTESRFIRLEFRKSRRRRGYGIRTLSVEPVEFSASPNHFFAALASRFQRGLYPRYLQAEQSYFTVVGADGGEAREGLLNTDGMFEVGKGGFSIEPFLMLDGRLVSWSDIDSESVLEQQSLPIPSVLWRFGPARLKVTAYAAGASHDSTLYARYMIENTGSDPLRLQLFLALRPFQVNPPWQSLNMTGGSSPIRSMKLEGHTVQVNESRAVQALTAPYRFGAATFDQGAITEYLYRGKLPSRTEVVDPLGYASGAFAYEIDLPRGGAKDIYLAFPSSPGRRKENGVDELDGNPAMKAEKRLKEELDYWRNRLSRVEFTVPDHARKLTDTLTSNLGYVLINRDGAALQPGSRTYARTWIRDGAMISSALLGTGFAQEVREFIDWFGNFQGADGRIPCCVDALGPDSVPENDSHGEFIFALAEYYRYTRDVNFVRAQWPRIVKVVDYIESLRAQRLTAEYRTTDKLGFYGLMPESISHEGYSARPVHAYWDDYWTLRGLKDAAMLALVISDAQRAERFAKLRDEFAADLGASIGNTMEVNHLDIIPASVELADFDPNATAIAVTIADMGASLPQAALHKTFDRWWDYYRKRQSGEGDWDAYTPYEVRMVEALVRLGHRERALKVMAGLRRASASSRLESLGGDRLARCPGTQVRRRHAPRLDRGRIRAGAAQSVCL